MFVLKLREIGVHKYERGLVKNIRKCSDLIVKWIEIKITYDNTNMTRKMCNALMKRFTKGKITKLEKKLNYILDHLLFVRIETQKFCIFLDLA